MRLVFDEVHASVSTEPKISADGSTDPGKSLPRTPPESSARGVLSGVMKFALLIAPIACFLIMGWAQRWTSDDGMINIRIAQLLLDGHGFVYNPGERVEAGTSTIWLAIIAALGGVGMRLETGAMIAGLATSGLGLACVMLGAWWLRTGADKRAAWSQETFFPLGVLIYAAVPVAWDYATSGLETGASLAWIGASMLGLSVWANSLQHGLTARAVRAWRLTMAWASLGPLVRPELAVFSFVVAGVLMYGARRTFGEGKLRATIGQAVVLLGAIPVTYQIWRMGYFASIVPNTALAKEAFRSRWGQGAKFFDNFFGLYYLLAPLALAVAVLADEVSERLGRADRVELVVMLAPWLSGLFYIVYVLRVGGGFMHGRMWLPPLFFLLAPIACVRLQASRPKLWRAVVAALVCVWALVISTQVRVARENEHGIGDERGWYARQAKVEHPVLVEDYDRHFFLRVTNKTRARLERGCGGARALDAVECSAPPKFLVDGLDKRSRVTVAGYSGFAPVDPATVPEGTAMVVMRGAIGLRGVKYGPGVHVVDRFGLADPIAARTLLQRTGRPGHEKQMPIVWPIARFTAPRETDSKQLADARAVLECEPVRELLDAVTEPMSPSRFWRNIWLAPKLHRLRIDPDPAKARAALCPKP